MRGILPGFQAAGISRSLEVHDQVRDYFCQAPLDSPQSKRATRVFAQMLTGMISPSR